MFCSGGLEFAGQFEGDLWTEVSAARDGFAGRWPAQYSECLCVCLCVCVCEREREREGECVCVCVFLCVELPLQLTRRADLLILCQYS